MLELNGNCCCCVREATEANGPGITPSTQSPGHCSLLLGEPGKETQNRQPTNAAYSLILSVTDAFYRLADLTT